ncbi:urea amidolyase associated protein UAAP1 [Thiomicrorhabdus sp. 6S3-12]|uniref:urea amidolyase associated protein UAAP1 n=1 Tax=Thiomicrorhabdus sp. 6S3-12 TaxID=2819681 RepID=UPI001AADA4D8|nr:urea amidolyase associated protein UAAP1 [Thiomicrorhabdus sp. 6S3-12]MBO1923770.1 urea carboxylase-associated family protein [Thiomicrorhabdus sp. 6S3-12]
MPEAPSYNGFVWKELIPAGAHWSGVIRRGTLLRMTDLQGGANVSMLINNLEVKNERYNMPDTLKAQKTAFLTTPNMCFSDMGRVMCSVIADTCGWHDTIGGLSNASMLQKKYGTKTYQEAHNDYFKNGHDSLINELEKWGLNESDIMPNLNWFSKVRVEDDGTMTFVENNSAAGDYVDLRFEMDCIVCLSTAQHPMDPSPEYNPKPVELSVYEAMKVEQDDPCRLHRGENERAYYNTKVFYGENPND